MIEKCKGCGAAEGQMHSIDCEVGRRKLTDSEALRLIGQKTSRQRALSRVDHDMKMFLLDREDCHLLQAGTVYQIARHAFRLAATAVEEITNTREVPNESD